MNEVDGKKLRFMLQLSKMKRLFYFRLYFDASNIYLSNHTFSGLSAISISSTCTNIYFNINDNFTNSRINFLSKIC